MSRFTRADTSLSAPGRGSKPTNHALTDSGAYSRTLERRRHRAHGRTERTAERQVPEWDPPSRGAVQLPHPPGVRALRRPVRRRRPAGAVRVRVAAAGPLRPGRPRGALDRAELAAGPVAVALPRAAAGAVARGDRDPRRGHDAAHPAAPARRRAGLRQPGHEGRGPAAHRHVQGPGRRGRRVAGPGAGRHPHRDADQRQRRRGVGHLRGAGRDGGADRDAGRRARRSPGPSATSPAPGCTWSTA